MRTSLCLSLMSYGGSYDFFRPFDKEIVSSECKKLNGRIYVNLKPRTYDCRGTSILRVIPSPANQVQSPHFTTCVRGLCHGITPLFLPADVPGAPLALRHAALCLAKRVYRRGSEAIPASAAAAQALQRPAAVS